MNSIDFQRAVVVFTVALGLAVGCSGPDAKPVETPDKRATGEKKVQDKPVEEPVPVDGLRPHKPVACSGTENIRLEKVKIETKDVGVSVSESCDVVIIDSEIHASSVAILISSNGEADVDIRNSVIQGGEAAYVIDGAGDIAAKDTKFIGGRIKGDGTFQDGGGNTWE